MEKKFLHMCEVCGKTEMLTAKEAFDQGWDYPPNIGKFGVISPRTCGNCSITDTLYWGVITGDKLCIHHMETLERILREPDDLNLEGENE